MKTNEPNIWIVGKALNGDGAWEFQGAFTDKNEADNYAAQNGYFVGPAVIGQRMPEESMEWPGGYYPEPRRAGK